LIFIRGARDGHQKQDSQKKESSNSKYWDEGDQSEEEEDWIFELMPKGLKKKESHKLKKISFSLSLFTLDISNKLDCRGGSCKVKILEVSLGGRSSNLNL